MQLQWGCFGLLLRHVILFISRDMQIKLSQKITHLCGLFDKRKG